MKPKIASLVLSLLVLAGCGGSSGDLYDCYTGSEALDRLCDAFNSGAGPLKFIIGEEYGPSNVRGEVSSEGSGSGEDLSAQGHLMIDIDPESNRYYLSGIHIEVSDFVKGVG